ncbi:TetR/AcrR family transcriptional regulator [Ferrimonas balearica]|uniref:TetR/AcrR family transcriptional regulator n=1 Tax=Ferrimonas balearica TaxID=44012 RepID=UPI001C56370A|nr:TetR/AcrR family transcriptional regulator [Ferrimonas balearica]MBW3141212.1 TetR/AcrR family transcriptional regulator [Ferrimonas balearica]MBW3166071.1 TetR/AcrR family transcriptional regulator [Ferrimonas balearica]MBY6108245.1 TetR/AcrR family transcriptional regulator [Ferrimonas balearica]MBY6225619.1 TetR/AcrR family transcriptional regulator [Ferrimonas balearica]
MKTKDRIIEASCELFNEHGERAVTTNHIAAHLGISPGNLYYHFRNKEQIIRALFAQYEAYLEEAYGPVEDQTAFGIMQRYLDGMFQGMWRFRFLYASLPEILARDPELHKRYLQAHNKVLATASDALRVLVAQGVMTIDEDYLEEFAEGIKMVVTFWISHLYTQALDKPITEQGVSQGMLQILALFHGYIAEPVRPDFERLVAHYRSMANE